MWFLRPREGLSNAAAAALLCPFAGTASALAIGPSMRAQL